MDYLIIFAMLVWSGIGRFKKKFMEDSFWGIYGKDRSSETGQGQKCIKI